MKIVSLAALLVLAMTQADAATITPHRAIYDLKLIKAGESASLSGVEGRLAFEVQGSACEGWTVSFRMVNQFRPAEGNVRTVDTQSTSFESGDGLDMRYNQKEFTGRKLQAESKIKVSRPSTEADGAGEMSGEGVNSFNVPAGAFFPVQHQLKLMDKAQAGETRDTSVIYDGSDGKTAFRAIAFIGKRKNAGANARDTANSKAAALAAVPSWPISISYYTAAATDQDTPTYQVGFDLYENGVATGLILDYGNFVLGGDLTNLELLAGEACQ
jgi:hypothetical protein